MLELREVPDLRRHIAAWKAAGKRVVLVPTMGNLHDGHLRLVTAARAHGDVVIASIFVNPLQFSAGEDFDRYPRTYDDDCAKLRAHGTDAVFAPEVRAVYPRSLADATKIEVPVLSDILCGAYRPGHFVGVATVVAKLFNLVLPDVALFGTKDYQQLLVIRRMVEDLNMQVTIVGFSTVREPSGLAMSSRNNYLAPEQRQEAAALYAILSTIKRQLLDGRRDFAALEEQGKYALEKAGFQPQYVAIRRAEDLAEPRAEDNDLIVLAAAYFAGVRLIDNVPVAWAP